MLAAFGLTGPARPLPGGSTQVYATGGAALKRVSEAYQRFLGEVLSPLPHAGFRLARALRPTSGWTHAGWGAAELLPGSPSATLSTADVLAVLRAGRALHAATAGVPRSAVPREEHAWARADAAAWGEQEVSVPRDWGRLVAALSEFVRDEPDLGPRQLIHGDLAGNVLLPPAPGDSPGGKRAPKGRRKPAAPPEPPGIIDFSPYFRPAAYAYGIVLADALAWHGHGPELRGQVQRALQREGISVPAGAVARGLLFRVYAAVLLRQEGASAEGEAEELERFTRAARAMGLAHSYDF